MNQSKVIDLNESQEAIYINEHALSKDELLAKKKNLNEDLAGAVAKFEIFESSSDDELSQGAFESAAQSYAKKVER